MRFHFHPSSTFLYSPLLLPGVHSPQHHHHPEPHHRNGRSPTVQGLRPPVVGGASTCTRSHWDRLLVGSHPEAPLWGSNGFRAQLQPTGEGKCISTPFKLIAQMTFLYIDRLDALDITNASDFLLFPCWITLSCDCWKAGIPTRVIIVGQIISLMLVRNVNYLTLTANEVDVVCLLAGFWQIWQ